MYRENHGSNTINTHAKQQQEDTSVYVDAWDRFGQSPIPTCASCNYGRTCRSLVKLYFLPVKERKNFFFGASGCRVSSYSR